MDHKISRRGFLKGSLAAVGAAGAAALPLPSVARGEAQGELATLIDIRKCIGCEACVEACKEVNEHKFPRPKKPFPTMYPSRVKVSDWSDKQDVTDRLTPYNWLFIQEATVKVKGEEETLTFPRRCMHCQNPPCADLCPWGAARKLKNGITRIDSDICLGGSKCRAVCPWHIPQRQTGVGLYLDLLPSLAGNGVMYKCDRCYDRIEKGALPACIDVCPEKVQKIGPRAQIVREAHEIAKQINGYIYGEKENGGTNTIYVSPVPFEELNRAVEKGPGKPGLDPVKNSMAHADNLAKAMVIAPVAGVAAAVGKFYKTMKGISGEEAGK
ncbi:MAG: 4Fe-4S dicluster domain-containing protein [Deltaproteobacteria bacterium]|nr:4Fe-4S dicluster domain-containing protein [Deltaproteobacteria bacterium]MBW1922058.1 4Fe-4S dicluster domain-containing protein [Deltaproteobacteria bacterium]MBW1949813.1 4Fe-4S dicluster domain-containing protein [Deltaproteobacteria bacterium]MBW2007678.1 4Fe-4S dicluster domain-containing protein [Deltaproteobacteria bacterium]MBW2347598.1 4Fe-4S dicluster domain-containing protein [Deltaproteobacteria bacterium]